MNRDAIGNYRRGTLLFYLSSPTVITNGVFVYYIYIYIYIYI